MTGRSFLQGDRLLPYSEVEMFQFKATEQQLKQIIFNAIEASKPFTNSLGVQYAFEPFPLKPELIKLNRLLFDYVFGRCVKLFIYQVGDNFYEIEDEPRHEYQTWACKYPTNKALVKSVEGVQVV